MDNDRFDLVCDGIASGLSIQKACDKLDIDPTMFYRQMNKDESLVHKYTRAREARADVRFDRMDELLDEVKSGAVEPNAARVLVDAIKWMAGKEKAKVYGDRIQSEVIVTHNIATLLEERMKKAEVIEHVPLAIIDVEPTAE
jgi:hypothetical protein